uniref:Uncharacterized protein n=1 Tax=Pavo cristatus TaxID=9049 RepID=A0A8C9LB52_PAVCR
MSVNIVAFGNERDVLSEDSQQSSLMWSYLRRSALISDVDSSPSAEHARSPVTTEYQACVFGNVRLVVHDCPLWVRDPSGSMQLYPKGRLFRSNRKTFRFLFTPRF